MVYQLSKKRESLTSKQQLFVVEYLKCWNASEAARRAGYSGRAAVQGSRLLKDSRVKAVIRERLAERVMGADEVLARLSEQARGSLAEYLTVEEGEDGKVEVGFDWVRLMKEGKGHLLRAVTVKGVRMEFYDSQAALGLLARHLGPLRGGEAETQEGKLTMEDWDKMAQERIIGVMRTMQAWGTLDTPQIEVRDDEEVGDGM